MLPVVNPTHPILVDEIPRSPVNFPPGKAAVVQPKRAARVAWDQMATAPISVHLGQVSRSAVVVPASAIICDIVRHPFNHALAMKNF